MPGPWIAFGRDGALECDDPLPIVRTTQRDVSSTMNEAEPVLAIPEGWVLDHASRECLYRRLSRAGSACAAVGAEWSELPPGTSHRVWSERLALRPESEVWPVSDLSVHGAAMIRPDVPFEVGDHFVRVERGALVIDAGTMVHDPWRSVGTPEDASPLGRPLPTRPVVCFLALNGTPTSPIGFERSSTASCVMTSRGASPFRSPPLDGISRSRARRRRSRSVPWRPRSSSRSTTRQQSGAWRGWGGGVSGSFD